MEPKRSDNFTSSAVRVAATEALIAGQRDRYDATAAAARLEPDWTRRYTLRLALIEGAIAATSAPSASAALRGAGPAPDRSKATEAFIAGAQVALDALEERPSEPVVLNLAGVIFYELWALDAARALFTAARRLDSTLPHLSRNLAEVSRRARARSGARRAMHPAIPALAQRAKRAAIAAQPAEGLKLSLCMIVRDEEEMLPRSLAAVAPGVDEIIVVDTGSSDRTIEIARSFGARVIEHRWTGSFAEARNISFDAATGDWILYLDADEVLLAEDAPRLRELTARTWREAFFLTETNFTGELDDASAVTHNALRIFRNRPEYRFEGRLHEQIAHLLPPEPERIEHSGLRLEHYGYLSAVRDSKEKSRRNIELLRKQMAESAESPFLRFNLGSEYAAAGDPRAALAEFDRAWKGVLAEDADGEFHFAPTLLVRLVKCRRACGHPEQAIEEAEAGLTRFPGFTDLVLEQAVASATLGRRDDARAYLKQCLEMGDAPARYTAQRGCGTYLPALALSEFDLQDGNLDAARQRLEWCLSEFPEFPAPVVPYAQCLIRQGVPAEQVASSALERARTTATARFLLAIALHEAGAPAEAERQYRLLLDSNPERSAVRVALGELLLAESRFAEAADQAGRVASDDPMKAKAAPTELFALLTATEPDEARVVAALAAARAGGLPDAQLQLFAAWAQLRGVAAAEAPADSTANLPAAALPLFSVILEALLRVQEFVAFEQLLALLGRFELADRERREMLAQLYLRRGYLASAADEWMAVCQRAPDPRALVGLATVAVAHGLPEDAATFAQEALAIDPEYAEATRLLERYALV